MAGTIEFMTITKVGKPLVGLTRRKPAVYVTVRLLKFGEFLNDLRNLFLKFRVAVGRKSIRSSFYPLGYIRVPENVVGTPVSGLYSGSMPSNLPVLLRWWYWMFVVTLRLVSIRGPKKPSKMATG